MGVLIPKIPSIKSRAHDQDKAIDKGVQVDLVSTGPVHQDKGVQVTAGRGRGADQQRGAHGRPQGRHTLLPRLRVRPQLPPVHRDPARTLPGGVSHAASSSAAAAAAIVQRACARIRPRIPPRYQFQGLAEVQARGR
jgi:hypothetical protein